jgi:hypothetical protein
MPWREQESLMVSLRDVLTGLGFAEDWDCQFTEQLPGYWFDFGNLVLSAKVLNNRSLRPEFLFSGVMRDRRSITFVKFALPLHVESVEQGAAWITNALDREGVRAASEPAWLDLGRACAHLLPWVRQQEKYARRPRFSVDRAWLSVVRSKLKELPSLAGLAQMGFDGTTAKISVDGTSLIFGASGNAWKEPVAFFLLDFAAALKRLTSPVIEISVWDGCLRVNNKRIVLRTENAVVDEADSDEDADEASESGAREDPEGSDSEVEPGEEEPSPEPFQMDVRDEAEGRLAALVDVATVNRRPPEYSYGVEQCDFCQRPVGELGLFVDGDVRGGGGWANMCARCFEVRGIGIGWGVGQLYARQSDGRPRLASGFRGQRAAFGPMT